MLEINITISNGVLFDTKEKHSKGQDQSKTNPGKNFKSNEFIKQFDLVNLIRP